MPVGLNSADSILEVLVCNWTYEHTIHKFSVKKSDYEVAFGAFLRKQI